MRIQPIDPPTGDRYAPDINDRAWLVMRNDGSGSTGLLQARAGDVTCLRIDSSAPSYTDSSSVTQMAGYAAIECNTSNAPGGLMLGGWHDTPAVGKFGRVQCSGWDHDARVLPDSSPAAGVLAIAVTAEPYVLEQTTTVAPLTTGALCTLVDLVDSDHMVASTEGNHAVWWRCL